MSTYYLEGFLMTRASTLSLVPFAALCHARSRHRIRLNMNNPI